MYSFEHYIFVINFFQISLFCIYRQKILIDEINLMDSYKITIPNISTKKYSVLSIIKRKIKRMRY